MAAAYAIPRALDTADRFCPGFTTAQVAWTVGGIVIGVACWLMLSPWLPTSLVAWPTIYLPVIGIFAKRRLYRGWEGLECARAVWHYATRPKRCVYGGREG